MDAGQSLQQPTMLIVLLSTSHDSPFVLLNLQCLVKKSSEAKTGVSPSLADSQSGPAANMALVLDLAIHRDLTLPHQL